METNQIPVAVRDLLARDKFPMHCTGWIGRKLFGYKFETGGDDYRRLLRVLNQMEDNDTLLCLRTPNNDSVWMLRDRDVRVTHPDAYNELVIGDIPF